MSRENLELMRRIYEQEMFGQDPGRLLDLATPNIEYVNPPTQSNLVFVAAAPRSRRR